MLPGVNHRKLVAIAARLVGPQDAEDVVQAAYLRLLTFAPDKNLESWAVMVVKSEASNLRTRLKKRDRECDPEPEEETPSEDHGIVSLELRDEVARKLKDIHPTWASALLAYHRLGSLEEAASELGITIQALKNRMHQGRRALRS